MLAKNKLPVSLAVGLVFEGLMKQIDSARITKGLQVFVGELQGAQKTLGKHVLPGTLVGHPHAKQRALSDLVIAQRSGLDAAALDRLLGPHRLSVSHLSVFVQAAADLRNWGMSPGKVVRVLRDARHRGVTTHKLLSLDASLARQVAHGHKPRNLGAQFRHGLDLGSSMNPGGFSGPAGAMSTMPGGGVGMPGPGGGGPGGAQMGGGYP
ncbi:MAG: hypothetical protein ACYDEV_08040 [Acidiferrobacter sp.]